MKVKPNYPLCVKYLEIKIPKSMEKPPNMGDYDGKGDPGENLQLVKERLNYYNVDDASKCRLFALSLVRPTRLLFNDLLDEFIKS